MNNDAVLISDVDFPECEETPILGQEYLTIEGSLKEIADGGKAGVARKNLNVYSKEDVNDLITELELALRGIPESDDQLPYASTLTDLYNTARKLSDKLENIQQSQKNFVTKEESLPKEDIATIQYIRELLTSYYTSSEVKREVDSIDAKLSNYAPKDSVYTKDKTYCRNKIDSLLKEYVKADGTTPFKSQQEGAYPKLRKHLATKGYSDDILNQHKQELDPHGFISKLDTKLSNYYQKGEVYSKAQTYSRTQVDSIIDKLVAAAIKNVINTHISSESHLDTQDVRDIIKSYALENLVSNSTLEDILLEVNNSISEVQPIWKTSGPVLTTVGYVEDNTELPTEMTMQQILDAIFYGSKISISVDPTVILGESTTILVCIHGGLQADSIKLYQNGVEIESFENEAFDEGCQSVEVGPLMEDSEFKFEVIFKNGDVHTETANVKVLAPCYVGIVPNVKTGSTYNKEYIDSLIIKDPTNNKQIDILEDSYTMRYSFQLGEEYSNLQKLFIAVPVNLNKDLNNISNQSQSIYVNEETFSRIRIDLRVISGEDIGVPYYIYIYNQPLVKLDSEVTFNFVEANE